MFIALSQHKTGKCSSIGALRSTQGTIDSVVCSLWGKLSGEASNLAQTVAMLQTVGSSIGQELADEPMEISSKWSISSNRLLFSQLLGIENETSMSCQLAKWCTAVESCPLFEKSSFSELLWNFRSTMSNSKLLAPPMVRGDHHSRP